MLTGMIAFILWTPTRHLLFAHSWTSNCIKWGRNSKFYFGDGWIEIDSPSNNLYAVTDCAGENYRVYTYNKKTELYSGFYKEDNGTSIRLDDILDYNSNPCKTAFTENTTIKNANTAFYGILVNNTNSIANCPTDHGRLYSLGYLQIYIQYTGSGGDAVYVRSNYGSYGSWKQV